MGAVLRWTRQTLETPEGSVVDDGRLLGSWWRRLPRLSQQECPATLPFCTRTSRSPPFSSLWPVLEPKQRPRRRQITRCRGHLQLKITASIAWDLFPRSDQPPHSPCRADSTFTPQDLASLSSPAFSDIFGAACALINAMDRFAFRKPTSVSVSQKLVRCARIVSHVCPPESR